MRAIRSSRNINAWQILCLAGLAALALFWARPVALAQTGAINGTVYADANGNGVRDADEAGVSNVGLTFSGVGEPVNGVTNTDGNYFFTATAGDWTVTVTPPPGFEVVNGNAQTVNISTDGQNIVLDFGLRPVQVEPTNTTPPETGPTDTPGILPTTGAPAAPSLLPLLVLALMAILGAALLLSALRGNRPPP
jgi:hypothetical protein